MTVAKRDKTKKRTPGNIFAISVRITKENSSRIPASVKIHCFFRREILNLDVFGAVAQLGEHQNRTLGVGSSNLLGSIFLSFYTPEDEMDKLSCRDLVFRVVFFPLNFRLGSFPEKTSVSSIPLSKEKTPQLNEGFLLAIWRRRESNPGPDRR